jgi:hypothetical protein
MGGMMSKRKGKRGERQVRDLFRRALQGLLDDTDGVRRNHQQAEVGGADLVGVPVFSVEVKLVKKLPLYIDTKRFQNWWNQACAAAVVANKAPCLVYRENNGAWHVAIEPIPDVIEIMTWEEFEPILQNTVRGLRNEQDPSEPVFTGGGADGQA